MTIKGLVIVKTRKSGVKIAKSLIKNMIKHLFVVAACIASSSALWNDFLSDYNAISSALTAPAKTTIDNPHSLNFVDGVCDSVKQDAGYITVEDKHNYFYWFFESRNEPSEDPLLIWLTGGPGCSSQIALFKENGPCKLNEDRETTSINPFGWNARNNIIFIDQPTGVGFSTGPETEKTEEMVATHLYAFMIKFLETHPQFKSSPFYITGESYAGHYIPHFARHIVEQNKRFEALQESNHDAHVSPSIKDKKQIKIAKRGKKKHSKHANHQVKDSVKFAINFKGAAIGNGLTDPLNQYPSYPYYAYNNNYNRLISRKEYRYISETLMGKCTDSIKKCDESRSESECLASEEYCTKNIYLPAIVNGVNIYDVRIPCKVHGLCYDFSDIVAFVNRPEFMKKVGANASKKWVACNKDVGKNFTSDRVFGFEQDIKFLLENNIRVLIYAGDADYICNWMSNRAWINKLEWQYQTEFIESSLQEFLVDGTASCEYTTYSNLTFMRVFEAGHMVPMDQPKVALEMLSAFTSNLF